MAELTETVADAADAVSEQASDFADIAREYSGGNLVQALIVGMGAGIVAGFFAGYYIAERRLRKVYEKMAEEEIDQMREHFRQRLIVRDEEIPDVASLKKLVEDRGYDVGDAKDVSIALEQERSEGRDLTVVPPPEPEQHNIFEDRHTGDVWDQEHEENSRQEGIPYVIHKDEFGEKEEEEEGGYTSAVLTYFSGDDVLCDEGNKPVDEIERVVGTENLNKFGHGSGDKEIVYVRNDSMEMDLEIHFSTKAYVEVVLGLKHEDTPVKARRPKWDD